jgi:hypothetical protein
MVAKTYFEDIAARQREEEEAAAAARARNNTASNWARGVASLLSGNEKTTRAAFSGDTNQFLQSASSMSDVELIATIGSLVIMSFAGEAGTRAGRRAGIRRNVSPSSLRETAAANDVVLSGDVESQLAEFSLQYNRRSPSQRAGNLRDFHRAIKETAEEDLNTVREEGGTSAELRQAQETLDEANTSFSRWREEAADLDRELSAAVESRAPPADVADLVIPDAQPNTTISRMVDELDPNVVNEVLNERVQTATEDTYNAELSATHPELARFTRTENIQQFNRRAGRYPTNTGELLRFMRSRDASRLLVLFPALVTTAAAATTTAAPTTAPPTRRRLPEGEDPPGGDTTDGIVIKPGGGQEVLPTKAPTTAAPTTAAAEAPPAQGEEFEAHSTKQTVIEHNTDELLERALWMSRRAYDPQAYKDVNTIQIETPHFAPIIHHDNRRAFVAFRGTSPTSLIEWLTDVTLTGGQTETTQNPNAPEDFPVWADKLHTRARLVRFHSGFLNELSKVYQRLLEHISNLKNQVSELIICGHSAGGALASIFTFLYNADVTVATNYGVKIPIKKCITFASPRCLINTDEGHAIYSEVCPDVTRVWLSEDLITYLPLHDQLVYKDPAISIFAPPYGFVHVGVSFCMDGNRIRNNINVYMTDAVQTSRDVLGDLLKMHGDDVETVNRLLTLTTSGEFLAYLLTGVIECAKVTQCKNINRDDMRAMALNVQKHASQLSTYAQKCDILKPFSVSEYLQTLPYGKDDQDTQVYTTAYASFVFVAQNIKTQFTGNSAHSASAYEERLHFLISRQINTRENITDPIRQANTERGNTLNTLQDDKKAVVDAVHVIGIYEGDFITGDMVEF